MKNNLKKWLLALCLSLPIIFFYGFHFFYHDANHQPSGLIQSEHSLYLISAKEYQTGNAVILYHYPLDDYLQSPKIFFQAPIFILGYLWKWLSINPGLLLAIFGLLFTFFTMRVVIEILHRILSEKKYLFIISVLFAWGGGILAISGIALHFLYFKGTSNISDHIFSLDPGSGWWCLNFGRSLIYPLEAFYHFVFVLAILFVLQKKFLWSASLMILLTLSHPYSSTELLLIVFTWACLEYFYLRSKEISKIEISYIGFAMVFHFFYYGLWLHHFPVSKVISQQVALDWSYKAWHFVPAYAIVWLLCFLTIKHIPLLKKQFSSPVNRLFFCWGTVAFLLSVHGFAIKPVQPLHYTRGYVYAGFFLFAIPAIVSLIAEVKNKKNIFFKVIGGIAILIFLSDNILWFYSNSSFNSTGILYNRDQQELIHYFSDKKEKGWVIGSEKTADFTAYLQLYSSYRGWIPHPILTFDLAHKKEAFNNLVLGQRIDEKWKQVPTYLYLEKNDSILFNHNLFFPVTFENKQYKVFKIN